MENSNNDSVNGLYDKYTVLRNDGSSARGKKHDGCRYFVLDLNHDKHSIPALKAYSQSCSVEFPKLAEDLNSIISKFQIENVSVIDEVIEKIIQKKIETEIQLTWGDPFIKLKNKLGLTIDWNMTDKQLLFYNENKCGPSVHLKMVDGEQFYEVRPYVSSNYPFKDSLGNTTLSLESALEKVGEALVVPQVRTGK